MSDVWTSCTYNGGTPQTKQVANDNIGQVAKHEAGHAYDFALAFAGGHATYPISISAGFKTMASQDLANLDAYWASLATNQRDPFICTMTGTIAPSAFEVQLGAASGSVCTGAGNGTITSTWRGKKPSVVLSTKMPYFINPPAQSKWLELWAQEFAYFTGNQGTPDLLPFVNRIVSGAGRLTCTNYVTRYFFSHQAAPPNQGGGGDRYYPSGCTPQDPNNYTHS